MGIIMSLQRPLPAVLIYDSSGKLIGQVPSQAGAAAKGGALVYGESFDVGQDGRVVVCDRGAECRQDLFGEQGRCP